jgi:cysteinyl-tRNA synthetase
MYNIPFKLFDSYLKKEIEIDLTNKNSQNPVKMYSCGPTVYSYAHIGNYRAQWLPDVINKALKYNGYAVKWVSNITDVGHLVGDGDNGEDKIEVGAKRDNLTVKEIVEKYTDDFHTQMKRLNINLPTDKLEPRASDYIKEQMILALELIKESKAYFLEDGIYFDSKENYNPAITKNYTGREIKNTLKSPQDFALWKFVDPKSLQKWRFSDYPRALELLNEVEAPSSIKDLWGCPGWHSECVAMIYSLLSEKYENNNQDDFSFLASKKENFIIDIHTGGEDHIDLHHKNEIVQSEALGLKLSKYWVHNKHVLVDNQKMSKSLGNNYRLNDLIEKGYNPLSYRLMLLEHHYTEQLNFTFEKLTRSQTRLQNLKKEIALIVSYYLTTNNVNNLDKICEVDERQKEFFVKTINDNLNFPRLLEQFQKLVKETVDAIVREDTLNEKNLSIIIDLEKSLLNLDLIYLPTENVINLAKERMKAKTDKDYQKSDNLRYEINKLHLDIADYKWGYGVWSS